MKKIDVLIVDDSKAIRLVAESLISQISEFDSQVDFAENGQDAYDMVKSKRYDLIITDIQMPVMDGLEFCSKVRQELQYQNLPILFMTSNIEYDIVQKAFSAGATDFIQKPFNELEFESRVNRLLEQKFAEKRLYLDKEKERESNAKKSALLAKVSHELKNPLNVIHGYVQLLEMETLSDNVTEMIKDIRSAKDKMRTLVSELLEFERLATGEKQVKKENVKLKEVVTRCQSFNKFMINEKQIRFQQNINDDIEIQTDKNLLETVLANLISNAVKYNRQGGNIDISCSSSGGETFIIISDTGIGMTEEDLKNLGQPFSRFSPDSKVDGHGLGMAITKSAMNLLSMDMSVQSKLGKGTRFKLILH